MANYELKYGTNKHNRIREAIRDRVRQAEYAVQETSTEMSDAEEIMRAYQPATEADSRRKTKRKAGESEYTNLDIPYSYAVLLSWHTYITTVFLSRAPVLQFSGRHGEAEQQIQAVEAIMDYETQVGGHLVPFYIWFLDAGKYGVGVVGNYWDEEIIQVSEIVEEPVTYLGIPIGGKTRKKKRTKRTKGYTGNRVFNIRPQDFIFDSRVSVSNFQQGEFCGRFADLGWNKIVMREDAGQYYNIEDLKTYKSRVSSQRSGVIHRDTGSEQLRLPDAINNQNLPLWDTMKTPSFSELMELHIELIPNDWGLGTSKYPEKWVFTLADDEVIIESQPYDALHGKFPYSVMEYEMEGYGLQKRGMLEVLKPLNNTIDWLVNTHFYNVRSVLNGQFIIDPSRVTVKDFKSEGGGRIVRLKPTAFGQPIASVFQQINTVDVTQNHMRDVAAMGDLIQRISGVTDNIMGMVNGGGRKTATEVRSSNLGGSNRLKTQAEYLSAMGFAPLIQMMLQNTQQKYDGEQMFKIAGDLMEDAGQFSQVTPEAISGFYDFIPVDGTLPVDRFAQVTMWTGLLGQMRAQPEIMQQYDMGGIFAWVAQLGGLKNIKRFRINVRPDEEILRDKQAGNLVGVKDGRGATGGAGGANPNSTGVPGAAQLPGLGPTG